MRKLLSTGVVVATALALVVPVLQTAPAQATGINTTVVLTFDHGYANQAVAASLLDAHGMHGTFYVNSNRIDTDGGLSWIQLAQFEAAGHEIGGDTLDNVELANVPVDVARTQVCQDRTSLTSHGLTVTDFAYPFGSGYATDAIRTIPQKCGYNSARRAWGLFSTAPECLTTGCGYPKASTIPPADVWAIPTADAVKADTTVPQLQDVVTRAEASGGGVVPIIFDQICSGVGCPPESTSETTLSDFLDWLQARAASGTVVKTMREVIGGPVQPVDTIAPSSTVACNGAPCDGGWYNASMLVTLAADDGAGSGVAVIRYTTDGSDPMVAGAGYTAPFPLASTATLHYRASDNFGNAESTNAQLIHVDATAPTTTITCDGVPCSAGYQATTDVTLNATDTGGSGLSVIRYTLNGSTPTAASSAYSSPITVSTTTTVKYRAYDVAGNAEATTTKMIVIDANAPASSIACNGGACVDRWFNPSVRVSLSATDAGAGVAAVRYTTDGSDPTAASAPYAAPFALPFTRSVKFRAWDKAGNEEATHAQVIKVDASSPTAAIRCNKIICSTRWSRSSVKVSLTAGDTGGSGLATIRYTTNGSTPTATSPVYTGPFAVSSTKTVKYRAFDHAANASTVGSMLVKVDGLDPSLRITAPAFNAYVKGRVRVTTKVTDPQSGVAKVQLYVDGRRISTDTTPAFSFVWNTAQAAKRRHTVTVVATDKAGNATTKSIIITVH